MIHFSTNTIFLITMLCHNTIFICIIIANHVFCFFSTTSDINIMILCNTSRAKNFILPVNAFTTSIIIMNTTICSSIKISIINIAAKQISKAALIASQ